MKKTLILVLVLVLALNGSAALGAGDTTFVRECITSASFNSLLLQYCSAAILPILIVNKILAEETSSPLSGQRQPRKDPGSRPHASFICEGTIKFEKQCGGYAVLFREQERLSRPSPVFANRAGTGRGEGTIPVLFLLLYCVVLSLSNLPAPRIERPRSATVPIRSSRVGIFLFIGSLGGIA